MRGNFSLVMGDGISGRRRPVREVALWEGGKQYRIKLRPRMVCGSCLGYGGRIVHVPGWIHNCTTMDSQLAAYEVLAAFLSHKEETALTPAAEPAIV